MNWLQAKSDFTDDYKRLHNHFRLTHLEDNHHTHHQVKALAPTKDRRRQMLDKFQHSSNQTNLAHLCLHSSINILKDTQRHLLIKHLSNQSVLRIIGNLTLKWVSFPIKENIFQKKIAKLKLLFLQWPSPAASPGPHSNLGPPPSQSPHAPPPQSPGTQQQHVNAPCSPSPQPPQSPHQVRNWIHSIPMFFRCAGIHCFNKRCLFTEYHSEQLIA